MIFTFYDSDLPNDIHSFQPNDHPAVCALFPVGKSRRRSWKAALVSKYQTESGYQEHSRVSMQDRNLHRLLSQVLNWENMLWYGSRLGRVEPIWVFVPDTVPRWVINRQVAELGFGIRYSIRDEPSVHLPIALMDSFKGA